MGHKATDLSPSPKDRVAGLPGKLSTRTLAPNDRKWLGIREMKGVSPISKSIHSINKAIRLSWDGSLYPPEFYSSAPDNSPHNQFLCQSPDRGQEFPACKGQIMVLSFRQALVGGRAAPELSNSNSIGGRGNQNEKVSSTNSKLPIC